MKKKIQQTYNVIFIWDKRPNFKPNPKPFLYFMLTLNNFDYGNFNLTIKNHIHGLEAKLWSNNEQDIITLDIL